MLIIENSDIVDWSEYPDYICLIVMQTNCDLKTNSGLTCPKGEEFSWLLSETPKISECGKITINGKASCMGGIGLGNGYFEKIDFPAIVLEIHYKPKNKKNSLFFKSESAKC